MRTASARTVALVLLAFLLPMFPASAAEPAPAELSGRVLAPDGTPVAGASLTFQPLGEDDYSYHAYATTAKNGSYDVELYEGLYRVSVTPPYGEAMAATALDMDCIRVDNADCVVARAGQRLQRDFTLPAAGLLRGVVLQDDRSPARYAYVRLGAYNTHSSGGSVGSDGTYSFSAPSGAYPLDIEGSYDRGTATLPYSLPCKRIDRSDCVILTNGTITWLNITLTSGGTLTGNVYDSDGVRVNDARVIVDDQSDYASYDGSYSLVLPAGDYAVNVTRGYSSLNEHVHLACTAPDRSDCARVESRKTTWLNITLPPTPRLRGFVHDADGKPVSASLSLSSLTGGYASAYANETGAYSVETKPGAFSLNVRPDSRARDSGSFRIDCDELDETGCLRIENGTTWLNITLPRAASLRGIVLDSAGTPLRDAHVSARGARSSLGDQSTTTLANGSYHLTLAPGSYGLTLYVFGAETFDDPVEVACYSDGDADCILVEAGTTTWHNITVPASASVSGTIRTPDGKPMEGASVSITGPDGNSFARTARNGSYQLRAPAGSYALLVEPTVGYSVSWRDRCHWDGAVVCVTTDGEYDYYATGRTIAGLASYTKRCEEGHEDTCLVLVAGQTADVSLTFVTGTTLRGKMLAHDGTPVPNVSVEARGANSQGSGMTDANGDYAISLSPGAYELRARPRTGNDTVTGAMWACVTGTDPTCIRVSGTTWFNGTLPRPSQLRGFVTGPDGDAVVNANVVATDGGDSWQYGITDATGAYLVHLSSGEFILGVSPLEEDTNLASTLITCEPEDCLRARGGETLWRNVTLERAFELRGVVKHPNGRLAEGVAVSTTGAPGSERYTDEKGEFKLKLAEGSHNLLALRHGSLRVSQLAACGSAAAACVTGEAGGSYSIDLVLENASVLASGAVVNDLARSWTVLAGSNAKRPIILIEPATFSYLVGVRFAIDGAASAGLTAGMGAAWVAPADLKPGRHEVLVTAPSPAGDAPRSLRFAFEIAGATPVTVTPPNVVTTLPSVNTPSVTTPTDPPAEAEPTPPTQGEERRESPGVPVWAALLVLVAIAARRAGRG